MPFYDISKISAWSIEKLQKEIEMIRTGKIRLVAAQQYELAGQLRACEKELLQELELQNKSKLHSEQKIESMKKIKSENFHLEGCDKFELSDFFRKIFVQFEKELNQLKRNFYEYPSNEDSVFDLNERAWVGLFNNALINAFKTKITTLQEYSVYLSNKKSTGRADLVVRWKNEKKEISILFEAKRSGDINNIKKLKEEENYSVPIKQAKRYYDTDINYFRNHEVYIVSIFFGRIKNNKKESVLNEAKKIYTEDCDFCALYYQGENDGAWVYGRIERQQNNNPCPNANP